MGLWGLGLRALLPAGGIFSPGFAAPALPGDGAGEGFVEQLGSRGKLSRDGAVVNLDTGGTQRLRAGSPVSSWEGSVAV